MGVIKRGILGGFSGKVANIVGSSWKGIAYMKSLPLSVANPRTAAQVAQRDKFAQSVAFAKVILVPYIKPLWDRFAQQESGYNAWISSNIDRFDATGLVDFPNLTVSEGTLTPVDNPSAQANNGQVAAPTAWDDNSGTGTALATDEIYVLGYNETKSEIGIYFSISDRANGNAIVEFETPFDNNDIMHFWYGARRADGTIVSNTEYVTITV